MARSTAALDLNDASLTVVGGGGLLALEPGLACASGAFGRAAIEAGGAISHRHWQALDDRPLPRPLGPWRSHAEIVRAQLELLLEVLPAGCEAVVAAVPPYWDERHLGLFLGLAGELGLPLRGLVERAVAASRRPAPGRSLWHLGLSLQEMALTRIDQRDGARIAGSEGHAWFSLRMLEQACINAIAEAFVQASRMDPRQDGAAEGALRRQLPEWLEALRNRDRLHCSLMFQGRRFEAELTTAGLQASLRPLVERLVQRLRPLPGSTGAVLQLPGQLALFPGVLAALIQLPGWEIITLEPGAEALGALRLPPAASATGLARVDRLPWDGPAMAPAAALPMRSAMPTHLAFDGRAFRLDQATFRIGSELAADEYGLRLPGGTRGLSRRHCSLSVDDGRLLLHDHSRWGTRLNGVAVEGATVLRAGDRIQIGEPEIELQLLVEEGGDGPPSP